MCHRQIKLEFANDMYYGELILRNERVPMHTPLPADTASTTPLDFPK